MNGHDGFIGFGGGFMWIFWILIIVGLIWIIKSFVTTDTYTEKIIQKESPLEILNKRYARGEIDEEEYHRRRAELEKD